MAAPSVCDHRWVRPSIHPQETLWKQHWWGSVFFFKLHVPADVFMILHVCVHICKLHVTTAKWTIFVFKFSNIQFLNTTCYMFRKCIFFFFSYFLSKWTAASVSGHSLDCWWLYPEAQNEHRVSDSFKCFESTENNAEAVQAILVTWPQLAVMTVSVITADSANSNQIYKKTLQRWRIQFGQSSVWKQWKLL